MSLVRRAGKQSDQPLNGVIWSRGRWSCSTVRSTWTLSDQRPHGGGPSAESSPFPLNTDLTTDATRRTQLANERTYLAWWRTGLTAFAVALGAGKLVPALTDVSHRPYEILGAGIAILGLIFISYASWRHREIERAVSQGEFVQPDKRLMGGLALIGFALGTLLLVLVIES